jgi:hypothetical protein
MKLQAILPVIALLGWLGGRSHSGQSGSDSAKKYTNPDENKKGGNGQGQQGQASGQGDAVTGGKADNNSGAPAAKKTWRTRANPTTRRRRNISRGCRRTTTNCKTRRADRALLRQNNDG